MRTCKHACKVISLDGRTFVPRRPDCASYDFMPSGRLEVIINFEVIKIYRAPIKRPTPREGRDIPRALFARYILYGCRRRLFNDFDQSRYD